MPPEAVEVLTSTATAVANVRKFSDSGQAIADVLLSVNMVLMGLGNYAIVTTLVWPLAKLNHQLARMKPGLHVVFGMASALAPGILPAGTYWLNAVCYGAVAGVGAFFAPLFLRSVIPDRWRGALKLDQLDGTQGLRAPTAAEVAAARARNKTRTTPDVDSGEDRA